MATIIKQARNILFQITDTDKTHQQGENLQFIQLA